MTARRLRPIGARAGRRASLHASALADTIRPSQLPGARSRALFPFQPPQNPTKLLRASPGFLRRRAGTLHQALQDCTASHRVWYEFRIFENHAFPGVSGTGRSTVGLLRRTAAPADCRADRSFSHQGLGSRSDRRDRARRNSWISATLGDCCDKRRQLLRQHFRNLSNPPLPAAAGPALL